MIPIILFAAILDIALGDPPKFPHPVSLIGALIRALERRFRARGGDLRAAGVRLCAIVVAVSGAAAFLLSLVHPLIAAYLLYAALAARCLSDEARGVQNALSVGVEAARARIARLVGRETDKLSREQIIMATVETVAENTVDGAVSPLFYMILGALPGAFAGRTVDPAAWAGAFDIYSTLYSACGWLCGLPAGFAWAFKAASTLDSMVLQKRAVY